MRASATLGSAIRSWRLVQLAGVLALVGSSLTLAMSPAGAAGETPATSEAASLEQTCLQAGLVRPTVFHAPAMHRAGIRPLTPHHHYSQGMSGWFQLAAMPEGCAPTYVRSLQANFQMQKASNRRVWINIGARNGNVENPPGNAEGVAEAFYGPNHAWPNYLFNECVGGKGWLKVRAVLMPKVKDGASHQLLGESRYTYPVKVYGSCKEARYSKRATATYKEEWGDTGSGSL
jgi:hypothetical protein